MRRVGIGVVGCGYIFDAYMKAAGNFPVLDIRTVTDLQPAAAQRRAAEYGLEAKPLDAFYSDPAIEIVLNLTVPGAHVEVGMRALAAGKHVYTEKPLAVAQLDGSRLLETARQKGLRIGSAPDTFLGGSHQLARRLVDKAVIGQPVGGTAFFMCPGHERWHPNPDFYYQEGGGPMFDMGPYYLTALVNLLGPVAHVTGLATTPRPARTITSEPRNGERIPVRVPTHVTGLLGFANGAAIQIAMSFDVAGHGHTPIEIYGVEGTLQVPDPNYFGGEVKLLRKGGEWEEIPGDLPWTDDNYRSIGLADMAQAIVEGRPHRASGELALHVLDAMEAVSRSSTLGRRIELATRAARPEPLAATPVARSAA